MMALGYWGLNQKDKSLHLLEELKNADVNHQGIQAFFSWLKRRIPHSLRKDGRKVRG